MAGRRADLNYLPQRSVTVNGRPVDAGAVEVAVSPDAFLVIARKDELPSADQLASDIASHPNYRSGQDVVLFVCGAGTRKSEPGAFVPTSLAKEIGNRLGARLHTIDGDIYLGEKITFEGDVVTARPNLPLIDISGGQIRPQENYDAQRRFWLEEGGREHRILAPFHVRALRQGARVNGQPIDPIHLGTPKDDNASGVPDDAALLNALQARADPEFQTRLAELVRSKGRITFRDFMHYSLYGIDGEGGYYNSGIAKIGRQPGKPAATNEGGDFITAPEETRYFGYSVANALADMHEAMGRPERFDVVEMGGGNGVWAQSIIERLRDYHPEVHQALRYTIIERSEGLIARQREQLQGLPVQWVHASADAIPMRNVKGVFISNELPDAFPVHWLVKRGDGLKEIYVAVDEQGRFVEEEREPSRVIIEAGDVLDRLVPNWERLPEGQQFTLNLQAVEWIKRVGAALDEGYVLTIDYGYEDAAKQPPWAVYTKMLPASAALAAPGALDITSEVNFKLLLEVGQEVGLMPSTLPSAQALQSQREFLLQQDIIDLVSAETDAGEIKAARLLVSDRFQGFQVMVQEKRGPVTAAQAGNSSRPQSLSAAYHPEGMPDPEQAFNLTPEEQQARRLEMLNVFLNDNLLYPRSSYGSHPAISLSVVDVEHFFAFGEEMTLHEFLLSEETFQSWLSRWRYDGAGSPLVLDISNPGAAATALAQRLSNMSGAQIIVPRAEAPTEWQILRPNYTAQKQQVGTVELSEDGSLVLVQGSEMRTIRLEEHLGQLIGAGGSKTAFQLYDKAVVVYRKVTDPRADKMNMQIEAARSLIDRGAPYVARILGTTKVYGLDAIIMDLNRTHDDAIERAYATPSERQYYDVRDVSLLNENSLSSLREMRDFYVRENIGVDDAQFLINEDGSFFLHDFSTVYDFSNGDEYAYLDDPSIPQSNRGFIRTIDHWIELAEAVTHCRQNPWSAQQSPKGQGGDVQA